MANEVKIRGKNCSSNAEACRTVGINYGAGSATVALERAGYVFSKSNRTWTKPAGGNFSSKKGSKKKSISSNRSHNPDKVKKQFEFGQRGVKYKGELYSSNADLCRDEKIKIGMQSATVALERAGYKFNKSSRTWTKGAGGAVKHTNAKKKSGTKKKSSSVGGKAQLVSLMKKLGIKSFKI